MADISMCTGKKCKRKKECYRFRAPINEYAQSYFANPPLDADTQACDYFWSTEGRYLAEQVVKRRRVRK